MNFQKIVLIIAIILLIISLVFIGISLSKSKSNEVWPPLIGDCPDYWVDMDGKGSKCVNTHDLGTCVPDLTKEEHLSVDFSVNPYIGVDGACSKYKWAQKCGVSWDGISYGYGATNPCESSSIK